LKTLYPEDEADRLASVGLDEAGAANEWWTSPEHADSKQQVERRIDDLLTKLMFIPGGCVHTIGGVWYTIGGV
jgi:hypothetical protein